MTETDPFSNLDKAGNVVERFMVGTYKPYISNFGAAVQFGDVSHALHESYVSAKIPGNFGAAGSPRHYLPGSLRPQNTGICTSSPSFLASLQVGLLVLS
jgi:hypothetical protein